MKNQKLPKIIKNNQGIETRVLIYVLGAIALMMAILLISQVNEKISEVVNASMDKAKAMVSGTSDSDDTDTEGPGIIAFPLPLLSRRFLGKRT